MGNSKACTLREKIVSFGNFLNINLVNSGKIELTTFASSSSSVSSLKPHNSLSQGFAVIEGLKLWKMETHILLYHISLK